MTVVISSLAAKQCKPCEGNVPPLSSAEITALLQQLNEWELFDRLIGKAYNFKNYYEVMAFVNAVAWISHREDHHPDITLGYNKCRVEYTTMQQVACLRTILFVQQRLIFYLRFESGVRFFIRITC